MFHLEGEDDGHRLPVVKAYNTCTLRVTLEEGMQDESSWAEVVFQAKLLNDLCVNGKNEGGYITTGKNRRIWIIIMSDSPVEIGTVGGQEVDAS